MTTRENTLTERLMRELNRPGRRSTTKAIKIHGSNLLIGEPDLVVCHRGRFLAIEIKTDRAGSAESPLQKWVLAQWERTGASSHTVRSLQDLKQVLSRLDEEIAGG